MCQKIEHTERFHRPLRKTQQAYQQKSGLVLLFLKHKKDVEDDIVVIKKSAL